MNDWMERKLPWGVNNFLRWFSTLLFWPLILLTITVVFLMCPFRRTFYNGAELADWPWLYWWGMVREDILDK